MAINLRKLILAGIFTALIIIMTVVPYTGYISYGPVEITTLHIVVTIGSVFLGWRYGAWLGFAWGITCLIRAFTNPLWIMFTNPFISVFPRIVVGVVAGLAYDILSRNTKLKKVVSAGITAVIATLTNTVLVLSAIYLLGDMAESYAKFFELFKSIFLTIISLNGGIELVASILIVPTVSTALIKYTRAEE